MDGPHGIKESNADGLWATYHLLLSPKPALVFEPAGPAATSFCNLWSQPGLGNAPGVSNISNDVWKHTEYF